MSVPESKIIAAIEHYQNGIRKHEHNKEKMLYYLKKLAQFPMTVSILQKTLVGLQINALRKYDGDVGNAAKVLVTKWKDVVRRESEGDHSEEEVEEDEEEVGNHNHHSDDSGVDNQELEDVEREESPERSDKRFETNSCNKYSDSKPKKDLTNDHSKKNGKSMKDKEKRHASSKKSKYDDKHKSSNRESSSSKKSHRDSSSGKKTSHGSSSSSKTRHESSKKSSRESSVDKKSKSDSRKRKHNNSDESESDSNENNSDSSNESRKSNKRRRVIKSEKRDSSNEGDSESDSASYASDSSRISRTDTKKQSHHKHDKSSKTNKHSHNHHSSSSSKSKDSSHKKSDDLKKISKDESKSSHSSNKTSHSKSERHKDKEQDKCSSKDKHSKSNDHHKSKSSKTDVKIKVEKDDSKPSKSGKESQKSQSPSKVKQEKDNFSVNSFEAALMGMPPPAEQTKVKVKSKAGTCSSDKKSSQSSESKVSRSSTGSPAEMDLFPEVKSDLDKDIASSLPELADVYRPLPQLENRREKPKLLSEDEALASIMTTKNLRTKVYSGNKASYTKVPSLFELCTRVLIDNIDLLEYTGGVPYDILKPVIERATPDQLFTLEYHNEYLKDDADVHWEFHCQRDFRDKTKEENETWRDLYVRCIEERQQKLERLTNNISRSIAASTPVRKTKLAYLDSAVKPPRNVIRKQNKNGTASISAPSSSKHDIIAKSVKGESSSSKPSEAAVKVTSPSMQRASNYVNNLIKKKKAPLMQKTLQLIKGNRFKR